MYKSFEELKGAALAPDATQADIDALGEWFEQEANDLHYWNGECWAVDRKLDLNLYPALIHDEAHDIWETVGYAFNKEEAAILAEKIEKERKK